ncbi:MAG: hypothetical protein OEZ04_04180 [Nitrospinota bacterium]|nr:hypothetical protein [Nitrospinota bacterium]
MRKVLFYTLFAVMFIGFTGVGSANEFWAKWPAGKAKGPMPPCGVNVIALGGDDILQATVDIYCGVNPGNYKSYIHPKAYATYKVKGGKYPEGMLGVLVFKKIDAVFTTEIKNGKPIYDVLQISTGKSIAASDAGHPLNPKTCEKCHASFEGVCKGYACGNRF